jgi:Tol biopolymer transport system component
MKKLGIVLVTLLALTLVIGSVSCGGEQTAPSVPKTPGGGLTSTTTPETAGTPGSSSSSATPGIIFNETPTTAATTYLPSGRIAFVDHGDIYVMNTDGSNMRNLTNSAAFQDIDPDWSPDGKFIAFASLGDVALSGIYIMNADGSNQHRITEYDSSHVIPGCAYPTWSPDGNYIAYEDDAGYLNAIFVVNADGSNLRYVIYTGFGVLGIDWSPDGKLLIYSQTLGYTSDADIRVIDEDANDPLGTSSRSFNLPEGFNAGPKWSPDGNLIAFGSEDGIVVMNADGSNIRSINNYGRGPCWSPDGKFIAFSKNGAIYIMNVDGSNMRKLTDTPSLESGLPSWAP